MPASPSDSPPDASTCQCAHHSQRGVDIVPTPEKNVSERKKRFLLFCQSSKKKHHPHSTGAVIARASRDAGLDSAQQSGLLGPYVWCHHTCYTLQSRALLSFGPIHFSCWGNRGGGGARTACSCWCINNTVDNIFAQRESLLLLLLTTVWPTPSIARSLKSLFPSTISGRATACRHSHHIKSKRRRRSRIGPHNMQQPG